MKSDLLRVVAYGDGPAWSVLPDEHASRPGRGAHLHPVLACLDQAERRRAFPRALRRSGAADTSALRSWIEKHAPGPTGTGADDEREWSSGS